MGYADQAAYRCFSVMLCDFADNTQPHSERSLDLYESGRINPVLFQATLLAMGVATFSLVFATLHYYWCSLGGQMSDAERALYARRADRFWLLGYTSMFLAPCLVLFLLKLRIVASVWLAFWLLYLFFSFGAETRITWIYLIRGH